MTGSQECSSSFRHALRNGGSLAVGRDMLLGAGCACKLKLTMPRGQVMFPGTLYLTDKHACFAAPGSGHIKFAVAYKDILEAVKVVDRSKKAGEWSSRCPAAFLLNLHAMAFIIISMHILLRCGSYVGLS